jgi:hypothetical protein
LVTLIENNQKVLEERERKDKMQAQLSVILSLTTVGLIELIQLKFADSQRACLHSWSERHPIISKRQISKSTKEFPNHLSQIHKSE